MRVQLVSETTLKKLTLINDNVDVCYIAPAIEKAQDMGLQPLIGTCLFEKLCKLVESGQIGSADNLVYKTLLDDYVTPYLCQRVMADIQVPLFAKIRNAGIVQSQDQQTQQLTKGDVDYIRADYEYNATFYGKRLTEYLCANSTKYPEWKTRRDVSDMPSDAESYNTSIVL